jgi:transcriptional regulator
MFHGPHAYISPTWYEPHPMSVPTWNFMAVHAYGVARVLSEAALEKSLFQLVDEHEKSFPSPWKFELTQLLRERMLGAIVGFEIKLSRIEGKFKLSQNRSQQDRHNVIAHLMQSTYGKEVAHHMGNQLGRK